jgi:alpha-1,4-digalacturonate transport system permease protein
MNFDNGKRGSSYIQIVPIILVIIFLIPIIWTILSSFKTMGELYSFPPTLFPQKFSFNGYLSVFKELNFLGVVGNTLFVASIATIITVFLCITGGYALAKGTFRGKNGIANLMLMTLFITAQVTMVPLFVIIKDLGLLNSLWGLIIPAVFTPTGMFTSIQYMKGIPDEFIESAKIDGANEWQIFSKIVVPLSAPLIAALSIFSFTWRWNDFILPLITINSSKLYTIQLALGSFQGQYEVSWNSILALSVLSMIPPLIIFLAFQKFFMQGLTSGGLKY